MQGFTVRCAMYASSRRVQPTSEGSDRLHCGRVMGCRSRGGELALVPESFLEPVRLDGVEE